MHVENYKKKTNLVISSVSRKYTETKKKRRVHKICNIYFIAWARILKIGQFDVLLAVTRTKKKCRVTSEDSLKGYNVKFTLYPFKLSL